ncbi:MAG: cytochrome C, partial [Planctomycetaceae bacterium]
MFPALTQRWIFAFTASLLAATTPLATAQPPADEFALGVRTTEPVSATEQLKSFTLPAGFSIQLVAAEPQLAKPMNLAFDARGRLWVSSSEEYPFAAPIGSPAKDTIRILEDTNGDFTADRSTVFADGLNIPIGLIPWQDGVICFSIPNIWFLRDTNGDNRCDERRLLYGPFDTTRD